MKRILCVTCALAIHLSAYPQFLEGWYLQVGGDWTIQKPFGYPAGDMISNGSTLGIDAAVGKWFTHELGLRVKGSWGNGIIDTRPNWLAPFYQPGENHKKGGFLSVTGDIMLDARNTILGYNQETVWNVNAFLRAGGVYNFGCDKGSPLIGLGIENRFRLNDSWSCYADVAYNGISGGFSMDRTTVTGTGSGQNMYFTVDIGVTCELGAGNHKLDICVPKNTLADNSFWKHWFIQFGTDMTLYNPCSCDFKEVFPKGASMGIDLALGKWFSPQIGARAKLNLENCLYENEDFQWVGYDDAKYNSNFDGGGIAMAYFDVMVSINHLFSGYEADDDLNIYGLGRMGLSRNRAISSLSPVVGIGLGCLYNIGQRVTIFADTAYEGTTSEFFEGISWSGLTGGRFNGIWDFNIGLQVNIGDIGW